MPAKLESALALAARGFKVFPIKENSKAPPLLHDWPAKATSDNDVIRVLWGKWPDANVGVSCEGMIVVDVDTKKGGDDSLQFLEITHGFPVTLRHSTPSGGVHLFYRSDQPVSNSVSTLGAGLDIRSAGGYVVAPGSTLPAGDYRVQAEAPIADAPDWLVQKLGSFTKHEKTPNLNVPDAPDTSLERAQEWLIKQLPAIEGCGGDAHTFKVVAGLRDFGVSKEQALDLLASWNSLCAPPWLPNELGAKVDNAYLYGQNEPGVAVVTPDDFPVVEQPSDLKRDPLPPQKSTNEEIYNISDVKGRRDGRAEYLVKGLLYRKSYVNLYGAPGEGKTFIALDLCYHIAATQEWMGRKIRGGTVIYVPFEGRGGLMDRLSAVRKKYGDGDVPFFVAENPIFNMRTEDGRKTFGRLLSKLPTKPGLIVIDTFAYALSGGDENSAQDVGAFNQAVQRLIDSTGACVMAVHHTGKNKNAGARGSSALNAAVDTEIFIDSGKITVTKQRDDAIIDPIGFKLKRVLVGLDEDGEEITSCIVEGDAVRGSGPTGRLAGNAKRGFEVLCDARPDNKPISDVEWKEACVPFLGGKAVNQRFYDIKRILKTKGYIEIDNNGMVTRRME